MNSPRSLARLAGSALSGSLRASVSRAEGIAEAGQRGSPSYVVSPSNPSGYLGTFIETRYSLIYQYDSSAFRS